MLNTVLYSGFLVATFVLLVIPGPTILTVVAYGISQGRRAVLASAAGVLAGDALAVTVSLLGLGLVLAVSPNLFFALKIAGAAYLLWLAIQTWRESNQLGSETVTKSDAAPAQPVPLTRIFRENFIVTALNPKGIVFLVAFIPAFVDQSLSCTPQVVIYGASFVVLGGINALAYGYSAGTMSSFFQTPARLKWLKRVGALFLFAAAVYTATSQLGA